MFNVYYFEKKLQLKSKIDKLKENYIKDQNRKKRFQIKFRIYSSFFSLEKNEKFSNGYKKRIENFILNVKPNEFKVLILSDG